MNRENDLIKPRYKVIANYPDNKDFSVGDIIEFEKWQSSDLYWANIKEDCQGRRERLEGWFTEYPHLFKKLEWWEERKPEEMPEYVKTIEDDPEYIEVYKIGDDVKHDFFKDSTYFGLKWVKGGGLLIGHFTPATESEYLSYLKTKTP